MIDISEVVKPEATFDVALKHPATGEKLGPIISVYGVDSAAYRRVTHAQRARRMKAMKPGKMNVTPDELDDDAVEVLAACTAGWRDLSYKGAALPFTLSNALMLYRDQPWVREQVDEAIADRGNFSGESKTDS